MTTDPLTRVLDAHGGFDRWLGFQRIDATITSGGLMFEMKGIPQAPTPRHMTAALQREWSSVRPFGADDQQTDFTPGPDRHRETRREHRRRTTRSGAIVCRARPDHAVGSAQRAYFNGYALWTYLTSPFLEALPGISVRELDPIEDGGITISPVFRFASRPASSATASTRSSTSGPTCCWHATTTASTWPVASRRSSTFRTSSRSTASGCRPAAGLPLWRGRQADPSELMVWIDL